MSASTAATARDSRPTRRARSTPTSTAMRSPTSALGFRADDGWNVFGWVRNAFDAEYFELLATQSGNTGLIVGQPGDPRTWGVTVQKRF